MTWPFLNPHSLPYNTISLNRSIGTFARALLDGAKKPQISLRLGAAAASRDITLFHAMDTLHQNVYEITQATSCLVPRGPVLCADELEAWTQGKLVCVWFLRASVCVCRRSQEIWGWFTGTEGLPLYSKKICETIIIYYVHPGVSI